MPEIRVPQKDGQISVVTNGGEPVVRSVSDHIVKVGEVDVEHFLAVVPGSSLAPNSGAKS